jgi:release factor glutamine methyltransferase
VLRDGAKVLERAGVRDFEVEAQILAGYLFSLSRLELLCKLHELEFTFEQLEVFESWIRRRAGGEPVAYIVQEAEFLGYRLYVDERVLIPRPDTELLFEAASSLYFPDCGAWMDVGTGSGAIAIAAADRFRDGRVIGTDVSLDAIAVARRNAAEYGNVEFLHSDLLRDIPESMVNPYLITANLPYISTGVIPSLEVHVLREPRIALDGGVDGIGLICGLIEQAAERCIPVLALEIGDGQDGDVIDFLKRWGYVPMGCFLTVDRVVRVITARYRGFC